MRRFTTAMVIAAISSGSATAWSQGFSYMPAGELVSGSGEGLTDTTIFAPGMRFPFEQAPAFANSQVYNPGGYLGPPGGQCDPVNYSYPWWDNYCEIRSWSMPLCPSGTGHQGQDIRPGTCDIDTYWGVAATDGTITNVGSYSVYLTAADGTRYDYLHMSNVQVQVGEQVTEGQRLGMISNEFGGTATTIHLHFNIRQNVAGVGDVYVPPYPSLVDSYAKLLNPGGGDSNGALDDASCDGIVGWVYDENVPDAPAEARLYFDGSIDDGGVGHPVLADEERSDLCAELGSCDHGFSVGLPLSLVDGDEHDVYAYAFDGYSGLEPELDDSPKAFSCDLVLPVGRLRPLSADVFATWRFSQFWDVADASSSDLAGIDEIWGLDARPHLVDVNGDLWLIDAGLRRAVSPAAIKSFRLLPELAETWSAAELGEYPEGAPLPDRPFLVRNGSDYWLVDEPIAALAGLGGSGAGGGAPGATTFTIAGEDGCGCAVIGENRSAPWGWLLLGLGLTAASRRRRYSWRRDRIGNSA